MHHVGTLAETPVVRDGYERHGEGCARIPLLGREHGSLNQAITIVDLAAGSGRVDLHAHAFEEALYVLEGSVTVEVAGAREELSAHDFCFVEVGVPHALVAGHAGARCYELHAPQPGAHGLEDTVFLDGPGQVVLPEPAFRRGRFDEADLPPPSSAIGLEGFGEANVGAASLRMLLDRGLGSSQFNLFVVEYGPGGYIKEHDHPFEEAFLFLGGELEAVLDGRTYELAAGDYCWSGVGSMHSFRNRGDGPVRWLETQAPQPPARHQARFRGDWERRWA
jgi:quercetin dioxygenase-like cupin family protein